MSLNQHQVFKLNNSNLHLGNLRSSTARIRAVLSVIDEDVKAQDCFHKILNVPDDPHFKIINLLDQATAYIHEHLLKGDVLVHCYAGVSRSATIVIAYLIKYHGYSLNDALSHVQRIRCQVRPNWGFLEQLKEYEQKHRRVRSYLRTETSPKSNIDQLLSPRNFRKSFIFKTEL